MAEQEAVVSIGSLISHVIAFLGGAGLCLTVKFVIGKYKKKKDSSVTMQVGNLVSGDQAGRDIKK